MKPVYHPALIFGAILAACTLLGCRPQSRITTYEIPKKVEPKRPDRMLGAIIIRKESELAWFVKASAREGQATSLKPDFDKLVKSFAFEPQSGDPIWTLPEGWTEAENTSELRFATLKAKSDASETEVTISKLPFVDQQTNDYLLRNVNRWRRQLGERPWLTIEMLNEIETDELRDKSPVWFVTLAGTAPESKSRLPAGHPPASGPSPGPVVGPPSGGSASPLKFTQPEGWTEGRVGGMRKAAFTVEEDGKTAEITVIDLPGRSGSFADNINRWRGQVVLPPADAATIDSESKAFPVDGSDGKYVELVGPKDTILGVIAAGEGGKTWFIKLRGERALAESQKTKFEAFVRSLQLP